MNDVLIIEGKQYISSRRAAEIAGYSNDYVGQLCRSGKLICKMIGRFWYVDEGSLQYHKKISAKPNQTVFKKIDSSLDLGAPVITEIAPVVAVPMSVAEPLIQAISLPAQNVLDQQKSLTVSHAVPVTHLEDYEAVDPYAAQAVAETAVVDEPMSLDWNLREIEKESILFDAKSVGSIAAVLLVALVLGFSVVNMPHGVVSAASDGLSANIQSAFDVAGATLQTAWNSLYDHVGLVAERVVPGSWSNGSGSVETDSDVTDPSAQSVIPPSQNGHVTAEHGGLVVVPASDATSSENAADLEHSIQNTFSDDVTVKPNQDGTTGTITPVFRTIAGHDFLYVLVPVKTATTTPSGNTN